MKGNIFQLTLSFIPEMWMALKSFFAGGLPKIILLAEFTGQTQAEANKKAADCLKNFQKKFKQLSSRMTENETDVSKYWTFRRESFNLLRSKMQGFRTAPFVEDVCVPVESMPEFIPHMQNVLDKYKFTYTIAGHAGNGNFHIIPLMKLNTKKEVEDIKKCNDEIFKLVGEYGGSISAEHNDGLVRTPYLHYQFTDRMLEVFLLVKKIFDANKIFNLEKKVGGSIGSNYSKIKLSTLE
jgi:FAD/FMN-containing dehydrogenase